MPRVPRSLVANVLLVAAASGCGAGGERTGAPAPAVPTTRVVEPSDPGAADGLVSPLAEQVVALGSATYDPREHVADAVVPTALRIDALGVSGAPVLPVGVDGAGELAVPAASDVGWYRYGPRPGEAGVTVLAAHIAFNGVDGVFRHLDDLRPGDTVMVELDDGTVQEYRITRLSQHPKSELPPELWARDGAPRLALVTCGGSFDPSRRSYEDNVVAWAEPT
jgi:LPXTG-site transpeptidase (sortase) family protein